MSRRVTLTAAEAKTIMFMIANYAMELENKSKGLQEMADDFEKALEEAEEELKAEDDIKKKILREVADRNNTIASRDATIDYLKKQLEESKKKKGLFG